MIKEFFTKKVFSKKEAIVYFLLIDLLALVLCTVIYIVWRILI